jgi:hypothetical protein
MVFYNIVLFVCCHRGRWFIYILHNIMPVCHHLLLVIVMYKALLIHIKYVIYKWIYAVYDILLACSIMIERARHTKNSALKGKF